MSHLFEEKDTFVLALRHQKCTTRGVQIDNRRIYAKLINWFLDLEECNKFNQIMYINNYK